MKSLERAKIPVRFVTNETQKTRKSLVEMLHSLGYEMRLEQVFPPALAMASIIKSEKLTPYCLVHPNCLDDLINETPDPEVHDSVILGDAVDGFDYKVLVDKIHLAHIC